MDRTAVSLLAFAAGPENLERRAAAMLMLAELKLDDAKTAAVVADALPRRVRELDDRGRAALLRHILTATERREVGASSAARLFLVRACAALALPDARRWLLAAAMHVDVPHVRAEALAALAACVRGEKLLAKEVTALIAIVEDPNA